MHQHLDPVSHWLHAIPLVVAVLLGTAYLTALTARRATLPPWPVSRTGLFMVGCLLMVFAFWPSVVTWAIADFRGHMTQHLIVGMAAPLALVLGAPVSLLLGSVSPTAGRRITGVLRSQPVYVLTRPWVALTLTLGPMVTLYFTPMYGWMTASPVAHLALHAHFALAGYLFAWVIVGPDPAPHRPSVKVRIITIGVAVLVHATASQVMYAGIGLHVGAPLEHVRDGAALMYFGGDLVEILLAVTLLMRATGRRRAKDRERSISAPMDPAVPVSE